MIYRWITVRSKCIEMVDVCDFNLIINILNKSLYRIVFVVLIVVFTNSASLNS